MSSSVATNLQCPVTSSYQNIPPPGLPLSVLDSFSFMSHWVRCHQGINCGKITLNKEGGIWQRHKLPSYVHEHSCILWFLQQTWLEDFSRPFPTHTEVWTLSGMPYICSIRMATGVLPHVPFHSPPQVKNKHFKPAQFQKTPPCHLSMTYKGAFWRTDEWFSLPGPFTVFHLPSSVRFPRQRQWMDPVCRKRPLSNKKIRGEDVWVEWRKCRHDSLMDGKDLGTFLALCTLFNMYWFVLSWIEAHHASEDKAIKKMSSMPWCGYINHPYPSVQACVWKVLSPSWWKSKAFSFPVHMISALHSWTMSWASTHPDWALGAGSPFVT